MDKIADFFQVRADGKLVPATMSAKEMINLGWEPCTVIGLKWKFNDKEIHVDAPNGIHAIVVPGGNYVAALRSEDASHLKYDLIILQGDGSIHGQVENRICDSGKYHDGTYAWFEPATISLPDTFGVVLQTDGQFAFRCDVDARMASLMKAVKFVNR